jgi:hypothetical protein
MVLMPMVAVAESIEDKIDKTLDSNDPTITFFSETIHFDGPDDTIVIVEPGFYTVSRVENWLQLVRVRDERTFTLKAKLDHHEESLAGPVAVNVYGDVADEPDISVLLLQLPDGTQLVADGSYSGIRSRGLWDRLRAARAKIQQRAQQIRLRAQQVRRRAQQLRAKIAAAAKQVGFFNQLRKRAKAMPKLTQAQKNQLKQRAGQILQANKGMLQELGKRIKKNRPLLTMIKRKGIRNLGQADMQNVQKAIFGTGDRALRLSIPVAEGQPVSRGLMENYSMTIGVSGDIAAGAGIGAGLFVSNPMMILVNPRPHALYGFISLGVGPDVSAVVNLDIGFATAQGHDLDGCDFSVGGGIAAGPGFLVSVSFQGSYLRGNNIQFGGIQVSPAVGVKAGGSISTGCAGKVVGW